MSTNTTPPSTQKNDTLFSSSVGTASSWNHGTFPSPEKDRTKYRFFQSSPQDITAIYSFLNFFSVLFKTRLSSTLSQDLHLQIFLLGSYDE